ncbi:MAG: putative bifunctional diguanylate cyclase/phosphodiesterase [Acidobacteriota bacterium]
MINVLILEDSDESSRLVIRTLEDAGFAVNGLRVGTPEALIQALTSAAWDIAIADHAMPALGGTRALSIVREHAPHLPFIFVSETSGEDVAVDAMKAGADDYIMRSQIVRLAPAVERELRDATVRRERARATERVAYLAYHDPLTDLPNRSLLQDRLQQAILMTSREDKSLALLVLDLDGFKAINDSYGHHAGDRLLQQLATRLRAGLRESDTIARLGGDEFAVLLPLTDLQGAVETARKILQDLEQPVVMEGRPLLVQGSLGIVVFPSHGSTAPDLLQKADVAMYLAKTSQSGLAVYEPDRESQTEQRLAMTTALRRGLDTDQFLLEYQPVVQLRSNALVGVEALVRWDHPQQGRLWPKDFIPLAERSGLITPLTTFVLERALTDWPRHLVARPPSIAVNLSPRSLQDAQFPSRLRTLLSEHRMDPSALALEITENLIMSDQESAARCLGELCEMGVRLIVDDFGKGYSSLSYLRRLPVHQLKIDSSFVIGMAAGEDDTLVRSIIDLAHNLRLHVVAEGVETDEVRARLVALGCDYAQGHFIRRPGSATEIAAYMATQAAVEPRADDSRPRTPRRPATVSSVPATRRP